LRKRTTYGFPLSGTPFPKRSGSRQAEPAFATSFSKEQQTHLTVTFHVTIDYPIRLFVAGIFEEQAMVLP
jgi:hypothetical protein